MCTLTGQVSVVKLFSSHNETRSVYAAEVELWTRPRAGCIHAPERRTPPSHRSTNDPVIVPGFSTPCKRVKARTLIPRRPVPLAGRPRLEPVAPSSSAKQAVYGCLRPPCFHAEVTLVLSSAVHSDVLFIPRWRGMKTRRKKLRGCSCRLVV